jgi:GT2 family glycosyltransferase
VIGPRLYPDYGSGIIEAYSIHLPSSSPGVFEDCIVCFQGHVRTLRLDPSVASCEFDLANQVTLTRLSRAGAAWGMLRALMGRLPSLQVRRELFAKAIRCLFKQGPGALGAWLLSQYNSFDSGYGSWIRLYDNDGAVEATGMELTRQPLISVLMPTYDTDERWLRACLDSVLQQSYSHWELCIADDASSREHVHRVLEEYAARDKRIKVHFRKHNGHISQASNSALELAKGEYVALLDHDDELHPQALYEVAKAINNHPQWKLIYSDEDKIDSDGCRYEPYFKPDWNYDLLLSQNCVSHLGVYETSLVREVGGFRQGYEGSQDWDLALRCIERLESGQIGHIPRVLYHWRATPGSTARAVGEKSYALAAGQRAVEAHLERIGAAKARVSFIERTPGNFCGRIQYALPDPPPAVSLIIPTRDRVHLLEMCVSSILEKTRYSNYEIIIVDNESQEPETLAYFGKVGQLPNVRVLSFHEPFNYSRINNFAVSRSQAQVVGLVNNDIEVISSGWLEEMVSHAMRPGVGAVGAMLYYPDNTVQHAGVITGFGGVAGHLFPRYPRGAPGYFNRMALVQNLSVVTAACLIVRREIYEEVRGLDEALAVAFNDVDFCLRVREAGYRNVWTPHAELYHHESASRGLEDTPAKQARFQREVEYMRARWGESLVDDPAYNPNLCLHTSPYALASPPRQRNV